MGDSFKFSLYELFGYLLPGTVALLALLLLDWSTVHADISIVPPWLANVKVLCAGGIAAYLLGHGMQSLSNFLLPDFGKRLVREPGCVRDLLSRARKGLSPLLTDLHDDVLLKVFEQQFQNRGPSPEREVYVYREGFYRGMLFPLLLLTASLVVLFVRLPALPLAHAHEISRSEIVVGVAMTALMAAGMYRRAKRFCSYRIQQALMTRILVMEEEIAAKEGPSSAKP